MLPVLVPAPGYDDLQSGNGGSASAALDEMLLGGDALTTEDRRLPGHDRLRGCERVTLGMVRLLERLRELAGLR